MKTACDQRSPRSFELGVPPEAAIARVKARLCGTNGKPGSVTFREHAQANRFYLDRWYAAQGVRASCSILVTVRPERDGCVLALAAAHALRPSDAKRATFMLWLWLFLLPNVLFTGGLAWLLLGPGLVGVFARTQARVWPDEHHREIVAALSQAVADVRRGGYRALAPSEPQAEKGRAPAGDLVLSPLDAVAHAAAHVGDGDRIVYQPHFEPGCFQVERRRRPGDPLGSTLVEVRAHGDASGCHLELRPHEPNLWVGASWVALGVLSLVSLFCSPIVLHVFVPLTVVVHFALKRRRLHLQPRTDLDCSEIESAVNRAFASVRRHPSAGSGASPTIAHTEDSAPPDRCK
ncbi:hypothetical protein [Nannocystis pusilla]|uniref:hypothetical protein n=1 Tax=Nannocystis pusilla TaxID=889268 RepID=UPI003DA29770